MNQIKFVHAKIILLKANTVTNTIYIFILSNIPLYISKACSPTTPNPPKINKIKPIQSTEFHFNEVWSTLDQYIRLFVEIRTIPMYMNSL